MMIIIIISIKLYKHYKHKSPWQTYTDSAVAIETRFASAAKRLWSVVAISVSVTRTPVRLAPLLCTQHTGRGQSASCTAAGSVR